MNARKFRQNPSPLGTGIVAKTSLNEFSGCDLRQCLDIELTIYLQIYLFYDNSKIIFS
jgi:hypothetical protein